VDGCGWLHSLGFNANETRAIGNDGSIVGSIALANGAIHSALWTPHDGLIDLGTLGGTTSYAYDVNSHLQVAGKSLDAAGVWHAVRWDVTIPQNHPPTASTGGPYVGSEGTPLAFIGVASDPDNDPLTVGWDFGDGTHGTDASTSHTYDDNGTYTATFTATDPQGLSISVPTLVTVTNAAPFVHLEPVGPILSGDSFKLSLSFTDPGVRDMPWHYTIDWGQLGIDAGNTNSQAGTIIAESPRYCAAGGYTVRTTVTDKDGGQGPASLLLTVNRSSVPVDVLTETINPRARGELPVVVLSTSNFDARTVDIRAVTLGDGIGPGVKPTAHGNGAFGTLEDVNHDGRLDLVMHFSREALAASGALVPPRSRLVLIARLLDECHEIEGVEEVRVLAK